GRSAAAVGLDDGHARVRRDVHLGGNRAPAERHRRRMLEKEDRLGNRALEDRCRQRALEVPCLDVVDLPEVHHIGFAAHRADCSRCPESYAWSDATGAGSGTSGSATAYKSVAASMTTRFLPARFAR